MSNKLALISGGAGQGSPTKPKTEDFHARFSSWWLVPLVIALFIALYIFAVVHWSYSTGEREREGWVRALSCKATSRRRSSVAEIALKSQAGGSALTFDCIFVPC